MRTLTTYSRPSLRTLIEKSATIEELSNIRRSLVLAIREGKMDAAHKTRAEWESALWIRVGELMLQRPRQAPYIYNIILRWGTPDPILQKFWKLMKQVTEPLPSDWELYLASRRVGEIPIIVDNTEITEEGKKFFESLPVGPGPYGRGEETQ